MKNSRLFPFERNRYFYGKLFTVRDFETEQRYFNDKRRLLNKLVIGSGIVSGLQVVAIDDKTLSIEPGIAIDNLGREIVVSSPVTQKLSLIEGFTNNELTNSVYLCLSYDEKGKEPVHSVSSSSEESGNVNEYNRINENYKIFIKEEDVDPQGFGLSGLVENTALIFNDDRVKIWQITPKNITSGDFYITVKIEKVLQLSDIEFSYELGLENITGMDGGDSLKISFKESEHYSSNQYTVRYQVRAKDTTEQRARAFLKEGSFHIRIGDRQLDVPGQFTHEMKLIPGPLKEEIVKDYYSRSLDECMQNNAETCIHLAKISLIKVGSVFVIEKVLPVPFNEYVYSIPLLNKLIMNDEQKEDVKFSARASAVYANGKEAPGVEVNYNDVKKEFDFVFKLPEYGKVSGKELATGVEEFKPDGKFKTGRTYFSEEIVHGLGEGPVAVILGLEEQEDDAYTKIQQVDECIFYGSHEIFEKSPYEAIQPQISMASAAYPKKGTFRIGIRLENPTNAPRIKIRWWVYRIADNKRVK